MWLKVVSFIEDQKIYQLRKPNTNTQIVFEYLEKYKDSPSKTIARKIYNENSAFFYNEEAVYLRVRYYRGQMGKKLRKNLGNQDFINPLKATVMQNYSTMPASLTQKRETFLFPKGCKKLAVIGDLHIPFHDEDAIETALDKVEAENVDSILINGDLLDFYQLSFHEKDPRKVKFKDEIEAGKQFFAYIRSRFPSIPIYFIPGNHENRFERYLKIKSAELLDIDEFRLDVILRVAEHRIEYIPFRTKVVFGNYLIEHGDKIPGAGGVVPARTALMKFKTNCIVSHFHKSSQSSQRIYGIEESNSIVGYSVGCLCDLHPDYMEVNEWNHGFAILTKINDTVSVENYKIENNTVL